MNQVWFVYEQSDQSQYACILMLCLSSVDQAVWFFLIRLITSE